jgi:Protein of unknown function (DUF559).
MFLARTTSIDRTVRSPEARYAISERSKGEGNPIYGTVRPDDTLEKLRKSAVERPHEQIVASWLRKAGYKVRRNDATICPISSYLYRRGRRYHDLDIVIDDLRIVVSVHSANHANRASTIANDMDRANVLNDLGYREIIIWNYDIDHHTEAAKKALFDAIEGAKA